jgi:oxaloacetate decarboxylase alpha subunit
MTYGHSATETIVACLEGQNRDTGLDLIKLEDIAHYFRGVRKKYAQYEGSLKGVDSRILISQVPGGMLTNMESQLKEQGASELFDEVLQEITLVREDLGFIPLVTPTSQIVGTQAVINVLSGERYKTITKEAAGVLKGEYGLSPAPVNKELQIRVLEGGQPVTCRPADLIAPEMDKLIAETKAKAKEEGVTLADNIEEDALIDGLFALVGWKFISNRGNPDAFEPAPDPEAFAAAQKPKATDASAGDTTETYVVNVNGKNFNVAVAPAGAGLSIQPVANAEQGAVAPAISADSGGVTVDSPMAGTILKVKVEVGSTVAAGDVVIIMEAMKMETEVRTKTAGTVSAVSVKTGDMVAVGDSLIIL